MRSSLAVILVALAAARAGADVKKPVVVWNTGNGWTTLTIEASGAAHYDFHPFGFGADPKQAKKTDGTLAKADLAKLAALVAKQKACSITSKRTHPVPEETRADLVLALPAASCTISLWSNEWTELAKARPIAELLDGFTERVRTHR